MDQDTLTQLGLAPDQATHITGNRRSRLINFLLRWEQFEAALACLDEMLALNPDLVGLHDSKTRALLGLEQPDAALEVMQARHQLRVSFNSRVLEARVHLAREDAEAALRVAYDLVSEKPENNAAWALMGEVHLARNDNDAALAAYRRLADLNPNSRAYLLGMLAFHQAQGNHVTASGYAVRLQRSASEDHPLPARTLRRLRDYYRASDEINRADDMQTALSNLYQSELVELRAALSDDLRILTPPPPEPTPEAQAPLHPPSPVPRPSSLLVSDQERQRIERAVKDLFGYSTLLPGQAETLAAALRGQDVLTVLPTGGGKSLCYQVPALLDKSGATLVISPLIALMKDQVDSLPPRARRQATTINSSLEGDELRRRMRDVSDGLYRLVYAAPERLRQTPFLHALRRAGVSRLVIDEAHCVSQWGHDFRPDYLYIDRARQALGDPALLAMTATAPPRVRRDIVQRLARPRADEKEGMTVISGDVYRPNLYLGAVRARNADEKLRCLLALCQAETGSGIVYAGTRARCEQVAATLRGRGIAAGYYHAGIGDRVARAAAQDDFMQGRVRVMVATVAFGMGVDKSDIRFIIHFQLPSSLEAYYQEAGRAGRDGKPARCTLIYSTSDRATLTRRARRDALPIEFLRAVYQAVRKRLGGASLGRMATDDLARDLQVKDTPLRVALSMLEEAGLLRRHRDAPRNAVLRLLDGPSGEQANPDWTAFVSAARLRPGQSLPLDPVAVAQEAGLDPTRIEAQLLAWADAGWLDFRPAGRDMLLELLPPPADASTQVEALIDRYATIQVQRVDEIAAYAAARRCRHGHISAYLSGQALEKCQSCDNCQPDLSPLKASIAKLDLPDESQQLQIVLRCIANTRGGWGAANLVRILRGDTRASQTGTRSPQWNALAFRSQSAVEGLVNRLVGAELLRPRQLHHGGAVLELTQAGRAALQDPSRLAPLVKSPAPPSAPGKPAQAEEEIGPVDEALYKRLRTWRKEAAQAAGVPPYVVAHNALLQHIAAVRPQNKAELAAIKGIGSRRLAQYGATILALVKERDADNADER
ncbi:MAG: RecQ family ATP-dependent DNA helicase [Anaerolineae bacterium]|jgi:ATP-dependent DNA helicase RecQ